jgi:hypothetical protein
VVAKSTPAAVGAAPAPGDRRTLGEIAQRNKKLNAWLRDVLNEKASPEEPAPPPAADRIKRETPAKA